MRIRTPVARLTRTRLLDYVLALLERSTWPCSSWFEISIVGSARLPWLQLAGNICFNSSIQFNTTTIFAVVVETFAVLVLE
jgi:hypothetical protein